MTLLLCMLIAVQPRFLGPPEKNPDAGVARPVRLVDAAPPLSGELLDPGEDGARKFDLGALVGVAAKDPAPAVLVGFFASWCDHQCKDELALVRDLSEEYRPSGLRAVLVDLDGDEAQQAAARALIREQRLAVPVVADRWQILARRWLGAQPRVPALFVVAGDGTVRAAAGSGPETARALRAAIETALGERR
jgi:peroxiredoxin